MLLMALLLGVELSLLPFFSPLSPIPSFLPWRRRNTGMKNTTPLGSEPQCRESSVGDRHIDELGFVFQEHLKVTQRQREVL